MGLALLLAAVPAAGGETASLAPRLSQGMTFRYDGSYDLYVPGDKGGQNLTLASSSYTLRMEVGEVTSDGALITAAYEKCDLDMHDGTAAPGTLTGKTYQFRLSPDGRIEAPSGWSDLYQIWPGWPVQPVEVGASWSVETEMALGGTGLGKVERGYTFCQVEQDKGRTLALLSYVERGSIDGAVVSTSQGQALLEGTILGVGDTRVDLDLGLPVVISCLGTINGRLVQPGSTEQTIAPIKLEFETDIDLQTAQ